MVITSECGEGSSQESENGRLSRLEAKLDHLVLKVDGLAGMQQQQQQQVSQMLSILVAWQSAAVPLALVPNI